LALIKGNLQNKNKGGPGKPVPPFNMKKIMMMVAKGL
jgi:hypothetical protein